MDPGYIDLKGINHLDTMAACEGEMGHRLWRESYYFNMTDSASGISLITTIGQLPNKRRTSGFVLILRGGKAVMLRPMVAFRRPEFGEYRVRLKGLEYRVDGAGWRLLFSSKRCHFDIWFTPVNRIFPYISDEADRRFSKLGSQHYEQFGTFEGILTLDGEKICIGPCLGHRDHSWGVRDWSLVDHYRLVCCAFSDRFAINLWEGKIGNEGFLKGYVFDGGRNTPVARSNAGTVSLQGAREPERLTLDIVDEEGRRYEVRCRRLASVAFPPRRSILIEAISEMDCDGMKGWGLVEHLFHEGNPLHRARAALSLLRML